MTPAFAVGTLWLLFGGSHIGMATRSVRGWLTARLGELGFTVVFYLVAATSFSWLITHYAAHRFDGAPGLGLADIPALRWPLIIAIVAGVALMVAALAVYPRLPSALFEQRMRGPRGIERISRHPFFAGMTLFAIAHALLATHAVGTVFFSGFALLSVLGAWHQDQKLLARRGRAYADYLAVTSAIPFAAIVAGRQSLVWSELEVGSLALGVGAALALRNWHDALFADGGVWIIVAILGGSLIAGANAWRRARRVGAAAVSLRRPDVPSGGVTHEG
jgi:uncharacterized membrane protein